MKRKVLCSILAILIILASVPMTAFAADAVTITRVDLTATKNLIEGYDCHIEYDGETGEPFNYYYLNDTLPNMTLTFSDGTTKDITFDEYWDYFEDPMWCEQGAGDKELKPGTHTKTVCLTYGYNEETQQGEGVMAEYTFTIEENPIESISAVATKPLWENTDGYWEDNIETDENGNNVVVGKTFFYEIAKTEPIVTIKYKNGETGIYSYDAVMDETGYDLMLIDNNSHDTPYRLGEDNVAGVSVLGVEAEFTFTIIPDPVEKVTIKPTRTIQDKRDGNFEYIDDEDESKGEYFWYDISLTKPQITVEYNDGTPAKTCAWEECYEIFGKEPFFDVRQSENPLEVGTNTVKVSFLGREIDYTFEIVPNPIKSVSLDVRYKLEENKSGYYEKEFDEDNYIGEYFYYVLDYEKTFVTVKYNDELKDDLTFCLDNLGEYFEEGIEIDLGQSYENQLTVGVHTGTVKLEGVIGTFTFEIVPNPVKKVEVRATKDLVENYDGVLNGEAEGEAYFYYYPNRLRPEFTITFANGAVKVYNYNELDDCGYEYDFAIEQSSENPLKPGTHTATASFNGIKTTFTFKIVEDPIKNIVATPTRDLVQYTDGYSTEGNDGEWYFWYDLYATQPVVTINYKDGTSKTYTYEELRRYTDFDMYIKDYQDSNSQLKLGSNKTTVYLNNIKCEYTFNIKKAEKTVTSISVVPEGNLVENIGGYFDCNEEGKEFFVYYSSTITYTVTIKYSDGTTKTYKGVEPYQKIEDSDFDVYFDCHSYDERFTVGKNNTGVAYYKNATCTFNVEVVKNDYKAIELSGDNNFVVSLVKQDGTKVSYTAKSFEIMGMGLNQLGVMLVTDKGEMELTLNYNFNEEGTSLQNISAIIGDEESGLKSNTLASNKWLDMMLAVNNIGYIAPTYADGYSKHYYNRDFSGISGTITGALVDDALTMCSAEEYYLEYENSGVDEKGTFAILSLEEAKELLTRYFDPSKIDITTSPMYNAPAKEIKVYFMSYYESSLSDEKLEYKNGKFVFTADWSSNYTDKVTPVTVVLANTGYVESISFTKGVCGTIKTISTEVVKNGVKVTYSVSENATEYEIYRSTNGSKYEKVGTSEKLNFVDTTVVSGKTYTYRVRGVNPTNSGAFSGTKTVSYLSMPKTTATLGKSGYTVKWTKVTGAATYRIYRAEYANGKWSNWNKLSDQKASVTSYADKNVKAGGVYKYTVRAMASGGVASAYEGTPVLVYLTTPTVKIANAKGGVKGSWNAVAGAEGYIIYRSEYNSSTKKWSSWTNLGTTKATAKSFTDKTAVSGKTYRYTVRAVNGDNKSLYTASNTLLYLAEPTVTIANAKTGIAVKWTKSGGAKGYTVYRSEYNASTKKWSSWKSIATTGSSSISLTDKTAKSGGTYRYTVRAVNEKVMSTFTASATLVRLAETKVTISNAKTGVTVKWGKVAGAKNYIIYRAEYVNGKWSSWKNMGSKANNVLSWTDTSALSGTTYRYTVKSTNGKSASSYTASSNTLFLAEPTTKIANASNGIKVSWNLVEGATGYTVYRSEYNAKTKKWSGWSNRGTAKAGKSSWTDKKVTSGVQYKYTVRAINGNFKSTYTSSGKLIYLAQPVVTSAKTTSGIVVKWTKSGGATSYIVYRQEMTDGAWSKWESVATTKAKVNSYTDKTVEEGKEYRYTVRAANGKYKSTYEASNSVKR